MKIPNMMVWKVLIPILCIILSIRIYKTQCINANELMLYNIITREWINTSGVEIK